MLDCFIEQHALDVIDAIEQTQAVIEFDLQGKIIDRVNSITEKTNLL